MIYDNKKEGVVIQIKPVGYKKGDETKSITIHGEDVLISYTRIIELYKQIEKKRK